VGRPQLPFSLGRISRILLDAHRSGRLCSRDRPTTLLYSRRPDRGWVPILRLQNHDLAFGGESTHPLAHALRAFPCSIGRPSGRPRYLPRVRRVEHLNRAGVTSLPQPGREQLEGLRYCPVVCSDRPSARSCIRYLERPSSRFIFERA
jgi:hypothetical protein